MRKKEVEALQCLVESLRTGESQLENQAKLARGYERTYIEREHRRAVIAEARAGLEHVLRGLGLYAN